MDKEKNGQNNLARDVCIIVLSIIVAVLLARSGVLRDVLASVHARSIVGSVLAGFFFVSVFTVAPATVILVEIAQTGSLWEVAFFGGIGALFGDLLIFRFIRDSVAEDIQQLLGEKGRKRIVAIFRRKLFKWLIPFIGALVVASPFPDEIGLAMMGLSKMRTALFIPISFALNFLGILVIGAIAKGFL